jgi:hypothetical protein
MMSHKRRITRKLAQVFLFSCLRRNLVNLVDCFPYGIVRVRGWGNLVNFYMVSLLRAMGLFLFACSLRSRNLVNLINYFRLRRDVRVRG